VHIDELWKQIEFLALVLKDEFMVRGQISSFAQFKDTLCFMHGRGFLKL